MSTNRCEIVDRTTGLLGSTTQVTLRSRLSAEEAWKRFEKTLPLFDVPPEIPSVRGPLPRKYRGSIRDDSFRLHSVYVYRFRRPGLLSMRGTIEPSGQGSLIRLQVHSLNATIGMVLLGLMSFVFLMLAVGASVTAFAMFQGTFGLVSALMFFVLFVPLAAVPIVGIKRSRAAVRRELTFLLDYLQQLFGDRSGQPRSKVRASVSGAEHAPESSAVSAAAGTERRIFRGQMLWLGVFGGVCALLFGISILAIFIVPAWQDHQQLQRLVETRCVVLDSRLTEEQHAETKSVRRHGRTEQVPTGRMITRYKPEFLIRYGVDGSSVEEWTYRSKRFAGYQQRSQAEKTIPRFAKGSEYACWYDPEDPQMVVLDKSGARLGIAAMVVFGCIAFTAVAALPIGMLVFAYVGHRRNRLSKGHAEVPAPN